MRPVIQINEQINGVYHRTIEPAIGYLKSDNRMDRCWLKGTLGNALHAISCTAGYNLRWLLRAIARLGMGAVFSPVAICLLYWP